MQYFGTELMRGWIPDIWVEALSLTIERSLADVIVIPDVRFINEVHALKSLNGESIAVKLVRLKRRPEGCDDIHASERDLDGLPDDAFDIVVPAEVTVEKQLEIVQENFRVI